MYDDLKKQLQDYAAGTMRDEDAEIAFDALNAIEKLEHKVFILEGDREGLLAQIPRWIPVSERLPEEKTYVLILTDAIAGKMAKVSFLYKDSEGRNCWSALDVYGKNLFDWQPTHWMPLPSTEGLDET